ncbi:MAG: PEP-CTERM sorting domain-containing protein [Planctomycetales bacterium]|nr:PEP-CTERM sorting domain-containing protein [Planctomycetales bacterium]
MLRPRFVASAVLAFLSIGSCNYVAADLYGYWPLNDGAGEAAKDLGPRGADGTIVNPEIGGLAINGSVWVNDADRGMVLGLNGTASWVEAGFIPEMTLDNGFTWSFWAKQSGDQPVNNDIILGNRYGEDGADTDPREFIKFTPRQFEYHLNAVGEANLAYDPFAGSPAPSPDIPSNDEWIHHAVVKSGDTLVYYRDGVVENFRQIQVGMASPDPFPFALGGQNGVETWRGYLSDVQLYESALDENGIATTMQGDLAAGTLYARWKLDDGNGDTAIDAGPNNFDGFIADWDVDGLAGDGSVWADDPDRGTVLGLGGNTAWVEAGELPIMDTENDFTWAFWAKQDGDQATPANDIIIGNRYDVTGAETVPREFIKFTPDRFEFHMEALGSGDLQYDTADDGPWVHHLAVKDGDTVAYYRDGEFVGEATIGLDQLSADPFPFYMGGQGGVELWAGYLSDVKLFDHAVTESEIAELSSGIAKVVGDYDNSGVLDLADINLLAAASASGDNDAMFDLTSDNLVDADDVAAWVKDLKNSWIGDSNLDGEFNSSDFVAVFTENKFERDEPASWAQGDWNGDGLFNSSDFVAAFVDGGFEKGERGPAITAVPEPTSLFSIVAGMLMLVASRRRR